MSSAQFGTLETKLPSVNMRPLHESDLEFLRELRNGAREWLFNKAIVTSEMQKEWYFHSYAEDSDWLIFIAATQDGDDIGYGQIKSHDDGSVEIGLAVTPTEWGKGYGTGIAEWLLLYVTSGLKTKNVWLEVYDHNRRAIALYEKFGFKVTEDLGDRKLRMELR